MLYLPEEAVKAVKTLNSAGYKAYIVGGRIRDALMGKDCHDIDIATSATPGECRQVFEDEYKVADSGIKYGTVTAVINGMPLQITTFRSDGKYSDRRRPDSVEFINDIKLDCERRDFTINAMAYNPAEGVQDFFGGQQDIENKIIRCVGEPGKRFKEDPLRVLRALRFSSVLGFDIEPGTEKAMYENIHLLPGIRPERVYAELLKMLTGQNIKNVLLRYYDILSVYVPPLADMHGFSQRNHHHIYDVLTHTAVAVENTPPVGPLRMAALLHDIGKPATFTVDENGTGHFYGHGDKSYELACEILKKLKVSNSDFELITTLVKYHDVNIIPREKYVRRALNRHGRQVVKYLIDLKRADNKAQNIKDFDRQAEYDELERVVNKVISGEDCFSLKQLAINGDDLARLGLAPSPATGEILNTLLNKVIDGNLENDRDTLISVAREMIKK